MPRESYCPEGIGALEWCARPQLDLPRFWSVPAARRRLVTALAHPPQLAGAELAGGLLLWGTQNQRRTFLPLADQSGYRELLVESRKSDWARVLLDPVSRARLEHEGQRVLRSQNLDHLMPEWDALLKHTAHFLRVARRMNLGRYRFVAVSSQHAPYLRAFLWEAARLGVPTLYVPHAPVADNALYLDLPTSAVGLRGPAEVALYAKELGVPPQRLAVVGNPASDVLRAAIPAIPPDVPGILALSPQPVEVIERIVRTVEAAELGALRVAPHPRSDIAALRELIPASWRIEEGRRTLDVLSEGAPFLLQHSSGVAWEAAALGIPTAEISLDGGEPNYHFLKEGTMFPPVRTPESISAFVRAASTLPERREEIREYARSWCAIDGADSRAALMALFETAEEWPSSMIFDGWGSPSSVTTGKSRVL